MASDPKTALITGASSGIGRALALWFAKRGTRVYAAARRTALLDELAAQGEGRIVPVALDVAQQASAVVRIQALDAECGGLDVVVANAGIGDPTPAHLATWPMVERVLGVNVMGAAATITAVLPQMIARKRGTVAGISSLAAWRGLGAYSSYSASKAFLSTFLESLRVDVHDTGVKVVCIEPGFVKTEAAPQMPFTVPVADAAAKIGRAILRGTRVLAFPLPLVVGTGALRMVPRAVYEAAGKRAQVAALEAEAPKR